METFFIDNEILTPYSRPLAITERNRSKGWGRSN